MLYIQVYVYVGFTVHVTGFASGSTIQSKTKGIWIWVRDHPMRSDQCLVLLDTEGLGDAEKVGMDK